MFLGYVWTQCLKFFMVKILLSIDMRPALKIYLGLIVLFTLLVFSFGCKPKGTRGSSSPVAGKGVFRESDHIVPDTEHLRSFACKACHEDAHADWAVSHHAHANRLMDAALDDPAFMAAVHEGYAGFSSTFTKDKDGYTIRTEGPEGLPTDFQPDMAFGYTPLVQYLIPFGDGRWQSTQIAWDPEHEEWFDVYGDARYAGEWGHWTGRGMNWNSQCAWCHMSGYDKNYDPVADAYAATWVEQGVSCIACHGTLPGHAEYHAPGGPGSRNPNYGLEPDPTVPPMSDIQVLHNCATCHSRREELSENFKPGDNFHDHFRLQLHDDPNLYYPDGQIRDEVYVFGSFIQTKMHAAGVLCKDCHEPHTGQLKFPETNNMICQTCHGPQGNNRPLKTEAPVIEPLDHSFHPADSTGNLCVECHMHQTVYMARDPRRDHGYHIPDPLLTKELGIPNACNRCHTDETVDWAIEWVDFWYGDKMKRPERERTRALAAAQRGEPESWRELLVQLDLQTIPMWEAALLNRLGDWAYLPEIQEAARTRIEHEDPLVRSTAVRLLGLNPANAATIRSALEDPTRVVRHAASWALQPELKPDMATYKEYRDYLLLHTDQPAGAASYGQFLFYQNRGEEAIYWLSRAIQYDPNSVPLYRDLAMIQNANGDPEGAIANFEKAAELEPINPEFPYSAALIHAEAGNLELAIPLLERTVEIDPSFDRAQYNLGLALSQTGKYLSALKAMEAAIQVRPDNPDYYYAAATIYYQIGQMDKAQEYAVSALQINQQYQPAMGLLRQIMQQQGPPAAPTP